MFFRLLFYTPLQMRAIWNLKTINLKESDEKLAAALIVITACWLCINIKRKLASKTQYYHGK